MIAALTPHCCRRLAKQQQQEEEDDDDEEDEEEDEEDDEMGDEFDVDAMEGVEVASRILITYTHPQRLPPTRTRRMRKRKHLAPHSVTKIPSERVLQGVPDLLSGHQTMPAIITNQ